MVATRTEQGDPLRTFIAYGLMLAASMLVFTGVLRLGADLHAALPSRDRFGASAAQHVNTLMLAGLRG